MARILFFLLFSLYGAVSGAQSRGVRLPKVLHEISGLAVTPDQTLWAINDGGNDPALFKINMKGQILEKKVLPILNRDWEELQADDQGRLWIGDTGNNLNRRKDLRFYRYDPANGQLDSLLFYYPDQYDFPPSREEDQQFDCEAFVWWNDTLHLFTKSRFAGKHVAKYYTLPAQAGTYTAVLRDSVRLPYRVVSGAAISPDGQTLVLTTYFFTLKNGWMPFTRATLYCWRKRGDNYFFRGTMTKKRLPKLFFARQFESVTYFRQRWVFANEKLLWQKPRLWY